MWPRPPYRTLTIITTHLLLLPSQLSAMLTPRPLLSLLVVLQHRSWTPTSLVQNSRTTSSRTTTTKRDMRSILHLSQIPLTASLPLHSTYPSKLDHRATCELSNRKHNDLRA